MILEWKGPFSLAGFAQEFKKVNNADFKNAGVYFWWDINIKEVVYVGKSDYLYGRLNEEAIKIVTGLHPIHARYVPKTEKIPISKITRNDHYRSSKNPNIFFNQSELQEIQSSGWKNRESIEIYFANLDSSPDMCNAEAILQNIIKPCMNFRIETIENKEVKIISAFEKNDSDLISFFKRKGLEITKDK